HVASGREDFAERHAAALATTPPEVLREQVRPGMAGTASMDAQGHPEQLAHYTSHVDYCKDLLYTTAVDSKGSGVAIVAPLAEVTTLSDRDAQRWQMLAAHVDAGHRLRQGLATQEACEEPHTDLPYDGYGGSCARPDARDRSRKGATDLEGVGSWPMVHGRLVRHGR
ncbi:MAG: hypothetical protein JRJ24_18780, partial [Deltaproteobacteria bacterium]|nr:hypothetical protein [Deltaproteobacteria bacterium]